MGTIVAVCTSPKGGIPKYPQAFVTVAERGFEGDFHNRTERWSFGRQIWVPNVDRHLLMLSLEAAESAGLPKGYLHNYQPGGLSENLTVYGLGDLSDLKGGELFALNEGTVLLRIAEQAAPCKHVRAAYGLDAYRALQGRRGVYCAIVKGAGECLKAGQGIERRGGGEPVEAGPPPNDKPTTDAAILEPDPA